MCPDDDKKQKQQQKQGISSQGQKGVLGQVPGATNQPIPDELFLGLSGPPTLAPPTLTVTTAGGGGPTDYFWNTLFSLDRPANENGYIIQQIIPSSTVLQSYWEARDVKKGSQYTVWAVDHGMVADDFWSNRGVSANATFYEGLQKLPDTFRGLGEFGHVPQSGDRPSTYYDPSSLLPLDGASNTVTRSFP